MVNGGSLISIIIPVYNVEKYLNACVSSVCNQTYDNLEIILIDDGSTDRSGQICDSWKNQDNRIVVIHQLNKGVSAARNAALSIARGDYIGFVDSDDEIDAEMYEKLYHKLTQSQCQMALCAYETIDEEGNLCKRIYENLPESILTMEHYLELINVNVRNHCALTVVWNKLYSRKILEELRFTEGAVHEDEFFLNDVLPRVNKVAVLQEPLYRYRQRQQSIMHVSFSAKRLSYFYAVRNRVILCEEQKYGENCIRLTARECMNTGVRFWLLITNRKIVSTEERMQFYNDVLEVVLKYRRYGTLKQRLLWDLFHFTPNLLGMVYCAYKRIFKKS